MMLKASQFLVAVVAVASLVLASLEAQAQSVKNTGVMMDVLDYSDTGADLGNEGFWFANFGQSAPVSGEAVDSNDVNQLPSWLQPDFDPNSPEYSFGDLVTSSGGQPNWNILTLPDGTTGPSGSLIDPETDNNSNNTIPRIRLGAGAPNSFTIRYVVDNTANQHDPAGRIRGRAENASDTFSASDEYNPGPGAFNGEADVYSFLYRGWQPGDIIKLQLNSGVAGIDGGIAGFMIDIPEPTSLALCGLALLGIAGIRRR